MASTDAKATPLWGVAHRAVFPILDADGDLVTGATGLDSEVSKDQGAYADCTNEATEIATNSGTYYLDLTATEMEADCVSVIVKTSSVGAKTTVLVLYTDPATRTRKAQAGANGTVTLDSSASATDDFYNDQIVRLVGGTGAGQARLISDYVGSTKVASIVPNWATNPDNTSIFQVLPAARVDVGQWVDGTPNALVSGRMDSSTGAMAAGVVTAAAIATDAITAAAIADNAIDAGAIAANAITSAKIADDAITVAKIAANAITSAKIAADAIGATQLGADAITAAKVASDVGPEIAAAVWAALTASHTVAGSFGQRFQTMRAGTAQAGASSSITLDASASATSEFYRYCLVHIVGGTGAGQCRVISTYNGTSKVASVPDNWAVQPDNTSVFVIYPQHLTGLMQTQIASIADAVWDETVSGHVGDGSFGQLTQPLNTGNVFAHTTDTITLDSGASDEDDVYNGTVISIVDGSYAGATFRIIDYVGSTKVATIAEETLLSLGSARYAIYPSSGRLVPASIGTAEAPLLANLDAAVSSRAATGAAMALTAGERTTLTNAILDLAGTVDGCTLRQIYRLMAAFGGGKSAGGQSDDAIRAIDDSKTRITSTLDANGHRSAVTLDLS